MSPASALGVGPGNPGSPKGIFVVFDAKVLNSSKVSKNFLCLRTGPFQQELLNPAPKN